MRYDPMFGKATVLNAPHSVTAASPRMASQSDVRTSTDRIITYCRIVTVNVLQYVTNKC